MLASAFSVALAVGTLITAVGVAMSTVKLTEVTAPVLGNGVPSASLAVSTARASRVTSWLVSVGQMMLGVYNQLVWPATFCQAVLAVTVKEENWILAWSQ